MAEIEKYQPMPMESLGQTGPMGALMPLMGMGGQPQLNRGEGGIISNYFGLIKAKQGLELAQIQRNMAKLEKELFMDKMEMALEVVTFSAKVQHSLAFYNHEIVMFQKEETKADAETMKIMLENEVLKEKITLLKLEANSKHIENSIKEHEMKRVLGL